MLQEEVDSSAHLAAKVAIVVRTKDRPLLLARAIDDLLRQHYAEWVAIVVNDGGDLAAIDAILGPRSDRLAGRVIVLDLPASQGPDARPNDGVAATVSDYVAIHDDDDTWDPEFLTRAVAQLDADSRLAAVAVATEIVYERIDGGRVIETGRRPFRPPGDLVTVFDLIRFNRLVPISMLIRRSAYVAVGGYDSTIPYAGDWDFNLRLARYGPIDYLGARPLAYWHQRPAQTGSLGNSVQAGIDQHFRYDRLVRDRALRHYLETHDPAPLLFLSRLIDERFDELERRVYETTFRATLRKAWHRVLRRG